MPSHRFYGLIRRALLMAAVVAMTGCASVKESFCNCDQANSTTKTTETRETSKESSSTKSTSKSSWWPWSREKSERHATSKSIKDTAQQPVAKHTSLPKTPPAKPPVDLTATQLKAMTAPTTSQSSSVTSTSDTTADERVEPELSRFERRAQNCPRTAYLAKTVAVNTFMRRELESAKAGRLEAAENGLATLFRDALIAEHNLVPERFHAPVQSQMTEREKREAAISIARTQQAQFVLQGYIDDMAMMHPDKTYHPNLLDKATYLITDRTSATALDKRHRYFGITLELRDGFTGEILFSDDYSTWAFWKFKHPVGFNTTQFQTSDYGKKIRQVVTEAANKLADTLACQPLIARLDVHPGRRDMLLDTGANHGLRAGDSLALYQLVTLGSNTDYMATQTRLVKRNSLLTLSEVYPSHANGTLKDPQPISGIFLAVKE